MNIPQTIAVAVKHHQAGRLQQAEQIYHHVLQVNPLHPDALHLLGLVAYQSGRNEQAVDYIGRAIAQSPNNAAFYNSYGSAFQAQGRLDQAVETFHQSLKLKPDYAEAHYNLGNALTHQEKVGEAAASYARAIELKPNYAEAHNNLGSALKAQGKLDEAVAEYQQAIELRPGYAEAHSNLGSALQSLARLEESETELRQSIALQPNYATAHANLGGVLQARGRLDEAVACYEQAVKFAPDYVMPYYQLADMSTHGRYELSTQQLEKIRSLLAHGDLSLEEAGSLHFVLAAIADRQRAFDDAFDHYRQANELRERLLGCREIKFDAERHRRLADEIIAVYNEDYFQQSHGSGLETELPVFVLGMLRSGTTLVEHILSSHPAIYGAGELKQIGQLAMQMPEHLRTADRYPRCMSAIDLESARTLAERHLELLRGMSGDVLRVVDKMPLNYNNLGLIATLFPRARVIHCRRDARDTCLSAYFQNFDSDHAAVMCCRLDNLGFCYQQYQRLMDHWRKVHPLQMYEVDYEELVHDQEKIIRELIDFCGLDWDDRCLAFHKTDRPVLTASKLQVRQPIYNRSINRWKLYEAHLQPLIDSLGER